MANKISCIVVDDDEVDKLVVLAYLETYSFIEIAGAYQSSIAGLEAAKRNPPDCLFLDIDMPEMNGLRLREQLMQIPACIFITSYPDYAVESFEMAALDFLVKPFSAERFGKTIIRLQEFMTLRRKSDLLSHALGADTIFIKDGHDQVKLQLHEVLYLEALNNYTSIVTDTRKYTVLSPISGLLKEKPFRSFVRIHRSYAVQKNFIKKISTDEVLVSNNIALPLGRTYKESLNSIRD
ncbi:MAG: response regulator transcription factor [Bacteroidetes bacterium]|nr:response regulator transcription factor [Bacteroidota bacterium]